ncbi:uncharacterized protein [Takifugu rubripes]|uniref:uncharacterized protein n=1 Tax=Takifugu rubripes TaxID=31033 RepID=UPI001145579B|nr:uncharacterized protein LOC115247006 [Takifugu rubripes]
MTEKRLLNERIRQIHFTINTLEAKLDKRKEELHLLLPSEVMEEIAKVVSRIQYTQHTRTKERQMQKFTTLLAKHNPSGTNPFSMTEKQDTSLSDAQREKWVKNHGDRELTQTEEEVLSKGLNFSVTPEEVPTVELITATETAIRNNKLLEAEAEQFRLKVTAALASAKPPTSNITNEEKRAIASLAKDKNITILPADKVS